MIRRTPTRIELKLEDIGEYNAVRQAAENSKDRSSPQSMSPWAYKMMMSNSSKVHERIGYVPMPHPLS